MVSAFGPSPIQPVAPGAIQAAFIGQQQAAARPREKAKPEPVDPRRTQVRDDVRLSDPAKAEAIDPKPDAAEEWKHRRPRGQQRDTRFAASEPASPEDSGEHRIDLKA
ncbi:MAG: hypothetical protein ACO3QC_08900 [Phycisphaerales bacterium]